MRNKSILKIFSILLGVMMCLSIVKVQAATTISDVTEETLNRSSLETLSSLETNLLSTTISKELKLSKQTVTDEDNDSNMVSRRENGEFYQWNIQQGEADEDGYRKTTAGHNIWKIIDSNGSFENLYYCLQADIGMGNQGGNTITSDKYNVGYDMTEEYSDIKSLISSLRISNSEIYNKIVWILDNSYIPTGDANYQSTTEYKNLMGKAGIEIDTIDAGVNLTENDIEVVQQLAIWYFSNSNNSNYNNANLPSLYINGVQLSSKYLYTTIYGEQITGAKRQAKAENLYKYFITNASSSYEKVQPTITISNTSAEVIESGNYYVAGPFKLTKSGISIKDVIVKLNNSEITDYLLTTSVSSNTNITNYNNLNKFYLKINKNKIDSSSTINIEIEGEYSTKSLTFMTDTLAPTTTQPVALVKESIKTVNEDTNISINLTEATVEKVWDDNNNQDGKRPTSIKVQLYKNGNKSGNSVTLSESNNWTYTWEKLLSDNTYTVKELNGSNNPVADGEKYNSYYTAKYEVSGNKTTITNTHKPEKTSVSGTKTWEDNNNQDGKRPVEITVNLLADGVEVKEVKVTSANEWKYTFTDLQKYANGKEIVYTITEDTVEGYTTTINGYNITNKYTPEKISVSGTKTWEDNNNQDGKRPVEITVNLLADGVEVKEVKVTSANEWKYTFTDLPKYAAGKEVVYTISEDIVESYTTEIKGYNITNRYTPGKVSKKVIKVWDDNDNQDKIRPENITVMLYKLENGQERDIESKELNASNNWEYTWTDLDEKSNGEKVVYGIKEIDSIPGYETTYSIPEHVYNDENTITITNKHVPNKLDIEIQKVDTEGKVITSSEATFEIKGEEELTKQTTKGTLNLNSQKLIDNTFEYEYTIKETNAPTGYNGISEELTVKISGTAKLESGSYKIENVNITDKDGKELNTEKISAEYNSELNKVIIRVVNTKIENSYSVKLVKVGEDGTTAIEGAWFKVDDGQAILVSKDGEEIATGILSNETELNLTYKLEETTAPEGYIKIEGQKEVKINAKVELKDGKYEIAEAKLTETIDGITISEEDNIITIKVKNKPEIITGKYNVILRKVDENGNILTGSKFDVNGNEHELTTGEVIILPETELNSDTDIDLEYEIKEIIVPEGYKGIEDTTIYVKATVQKIDKNFKLVRVNLVDKEGKTVTDENISVKIEGNSIVIAVTNKPVEKKFDLSLRKFITKINDTEYSREPIVDTSTIATTGTATYKHTKQPIAVQKGDVVTYTIRVYNEGEVDGYVEMITDHLPDHLLPITIGTEGIDEEKYAEEIEFNLNWGWINSGDGKSVTTIKTSKANSETYSLMEGFENVTDTKLNAYVEGSNTLDYIDVQIKCLVTENAISGEYLTNIAEISKMCDAEGVEVETDRDSTKANADISNLANYKNAEAINSNEESYIAGQEDDDDFEKLVVKEFDLSLRKFITKVNETAHSRQPQVDTSKLGTTVDGKVITTATYSHTKEPLIVETNDLVTYTIRIYNEGTLAGFANEITDDIPEGLEFMPDSSVNVSYRWKMLDAEGNETTDASKAVMIVTDYLSDIDKNNVINPVAEIEGVKTLSYKDVQVQFKVVAKAENLKDNIIINEAQISADSDRDIDSVPNRNEKYDYTTGNNEDDIDYEPIKLQYFDLALRKFVTKVNDIDYNNRYPEIQYNEDGSIKYNHTKDPVLVATHDIVEYTIRVYNEGEKAGYATEITDNLPDGLEYLPENETNKQYNWKMLDADGNITEELSKAEKFSTDYLKEELIEALVDSEGSKVLSYKDVKIAFKVVEPNTSDRILVNIAQISNDSDDDIDSVPNNNIETEDDLDKEYLKVQYFDLSLKKWVTASKVTYNGKTTTTKTGFTEDSEEIAKVDLVADKMTKTTVKFVYSIKVTNEGELPGYAYEVKDYIPKGLKFVQEDNKDWKELEDGSVVTEKLQDTVLNPGESATVEIVLTWKNSTTNTGLKTNYAEISKDSSEDIDSTPDNYNKKEDDIDDAQVILSIKTAGPQTYIGLVLISVVILAGGIFSIKKYVID